MLCVSAQAKVIINEKTTYYTVTGNSGRAINKSIKAYRIVGSKKTNQIGVTHVVFATKNILTNYSGGKCGIKYVDVVVNINYILPKWKKTKLTSKQLNKNWNSFSKAVMDHEKVHGNIWKEAYKNIDSKIKKTSFNDSPNCSKLQFKIKQITGVEEAKAHLLNKKFELKDKRKSSVISRAFLKLVATK